MSSEKQQINSNNFVTLDSFKEYAKIKDKLDDATILRIVSTGNNEMKKKLVTVVDNITAIEGTHFFGEATDAVLTFCLSQYRRDVNHLYKEAKDILADYNSQLETLLDDVRATAPERTSKLITKSYLNLSVSFSFR